VTTVPLFEASGGTTLVAAPGQGPGWWAGAPARADWRGRSLLAYRLRAPRPRRGYAVRIARLAGDDVRDVHEISATAIGSPSLERPCLVGRGDRLLLYLSSVDPRDGRWRIDALSAPDETTLEPASRRPVLTAAGSGTEGVKDPVIVPDGDGLVMYMSVAIGATGPDHSSRDVFDTGTVRSGTGRARSHDGVTWRWEGVALDPDGTGWDAYETRLSCFVAPRVALYDGIARAEDNYRERTGVAELREDGTWVRPTREAPLAPARYAAFDGERFFWEHENADGSHELRAAVPGRTLDTAALR
jgi:hypothetical protein